MSAEHDAGAEVPAHCPNCQGALATDTSRPKHCPACGQATVLHAPTFFEFAHEFVGHYVALEGSLWRTLGNLIGKPGYLTVAYLRGRRHRYVLPLRVFLSASFVFFLIVKVLGAPALGIEVDASDKDARAALERCQPAGPEPCSDAERALLEQIVKYRNQPERVAAVRSRMASVAPYAVFAMVPFAAAILQLAYLRRRRNFGEHFVFALHEHGFAFLAMLVAALTPFGIALALIVVVHALLAMRRVYGGRWWTTTLRAAFVAALYLVALGIVTGLIALWALRSG